MKLVLSHPTGNQNVRAALKGLLNEKLLSQFYTSIASFPGTFLDTIGSIKELSEIRRRRFYPGLRSITHTSPWLEVGRIIASKAGLTKLIKNETGIVSIDAIYRNLDKLVSSRLKNLAKKGINGIYCYEDGAMKSFYEAKKYGIECFYDLPIGYWKTSRELLEFERERWPEWASTLTGFIDSDFKLARKDEELRRADAIFVASNFTANTLKKFPGNLAPVSIIPYGFPPVNSERFYEQINKRPLKLLFVGGLSQRKGIADLFSVADKLGRHIELTVVGRKATDNCKPLNEALKKHQWIPSLPHNKILQLMQRNDVLVFPSLFEGFGLVITEAMSQGTPVITTGRTAGPDLIEHGRNGWLIDAGSTDALHGAIENLLHNPGLIPKAGCAAMDTANKRPWEVYGKELAAAIMKSSSCSGINS